MMKKLLLIGAMVFASIVEARVYDAIALIVEGEAVTTSEIRNVRNKLGVSKKEAIDLLIQDRLQKIAMKDIQVSESELDNRIAAIAKQNNISTKKMRSILRSQGTSWTQYRNSIKSAIKQERFFRQVVAKEVPEPSEDQLRLLYKKHQSKLTVPSNIHVTEYSAPTQEKIKKFLKSKKGLKGKSMTKKVSTLNPAMKEMLLRTPNGSFTRSMNAGDRYVVYKVRSKSGKNKMDFESAKPMLTGLWKQEQQGKALKDYFSKMKRRADIEYIRK